MNGDNQKPAEQPVQPHENATQPEAIPTMSFTQPADAMPREVSWTASEFVAHEKSAGWYGALGLATVVAAGIAYFITRDIVAIVAIVMVALIFGYVAGHQPRVLSYRLDNHGLTISQKMYRYGVFKSFSLIDEGAFASITLMPLRRFMPPISIYFSPEDEEKIVSVLGQHLPMTQQGHDLIDRFMRRIKF